MLQINTFVPRTAGSLLPGGIKIGKPSSRNSLSSPHFKMQRKDVHALLLKQSARANFFTSLDARRAEQLEQGAARRSEQREHAKALRRGISFDSPSRSRFIPLEFVARPGFHGMLQQHRITAISQRFCRATVEAERFRELRGNEAVRILHNARYYVNDRIAAVRFHQHCVDDSVRHSQEDLEGFSRTLQGLDHCIVNALLKCKTLIGMMGSHATVFYGFARTIGWDWAGLEEVTAYLGQLRDYNLLAIGDGIALTHDHLMDLSELLNSQPLVWEMRAITGQAVEVEVSVQPPCSGHAALVASPPSPQTKSDASGQLTTTPTYVPQTQDTSLPSLAALPRVLTTTGVNTAASSSPTPSPNPARTLVSGVSVISAENINSIDDLASAICDNTLQDGLKQEEVKLLDRLHNGYCLSIKKEGFMELQLHAFEYFLRHSEKDWFDVKAIKANDRIDGEFLWWDSGFYSVQRVISDTWGGTSVSDDLKDFMKAQLQVKVILHGQAGRKLATVTRKTVSK